MATYKKPPKTTASHLLNAKFTNRKYALPNTSDMRKQNGPVKIVKPRKDDKLDN